MWKLILFAAMWALVLWFLHGSEQFASALMVSPILIGAIYQFLVSNTDEAT